jgi:hypothetical protein
VHVVRIRSNVHGDPDAKIERIVGAEIVRPRLESAPIAASRIGVIGLCHARFRLSGSPDRRLRKRDFRLLVWKVEPGSCMFFRC